MSDAWSLEGATIGDGDEIPNSLAARVLLIQASIVDVTAIRAVTDLLPDAGVLSSISDETDKIDQAITDGLVGVYDSLASRAHEVQHHFHNCERWFETAAVPDGEDHVADAISSGNGAFSLDAGNDDWGSWVQILGTNDTPATAGEVKYDLRRIEVSAAERNAVYFLQLAFGASGAAGLSAGNYTESVFKPLSNQIDSGPMMVQNMRQDVGTKAWTRCMCPGQNTATLSLFLGIHEYPG